LFTPALDFRAFRSLCMLPSASRILDRLATRPDFRRRFGQLLKTLATVFYSKDSSQSMDAVYFASSIDGSGSLRLAPSCDNQCHTHSERFGPIE